MSSDEKAALKNLAINAVLGFLVYKFMPVQAFKAGGAGVVAVSAVGAVRLIGKF